MRRCYVLLVYSIGAEPQAMSTSIQPGPTTRKSRTRRGYMLGMPPALHVDVILFSKKLIAAIFDYGASTGHQELAAHTALKSCSVLELELALSAA
ncbi:hypothetical protein BV20DRAFT_969031 [Pilatotrama ljubarskyi]|nr:hypothetical protein BV20DRAFT_969031 [Pilatotrama ljubarskyi]